MYLQTRRESRITKNQKDVEEPSKVEEKSVLADVILQTVPKEAQVGNPIGSPIMNGYRKEISNENVVSEADKKHIGVVNPAFENDDNNYEEFEKRNNEINKSINVGNDSKSIIENAAFNKEV